LQALSNLLLHLDLSDVFHLHDSKRNLALGEPVAAMYAFQDLRPWNP